MTDSGDRYCLLAAIEGKGHGQPIGKVPGLLMGDIVIIVGLAVFLLLFLMLVVRYAYYRKPRKKHRSDARKVFRRPGQVEEDEDSEAESQEAKRRYKYRWKRRDHRVRNPTLAEAGGLPPERTREPTEQS